MSRLSQAEAHLAQARRAFMQNPTPALASSMKRLAGVIKYERRVAAESAKGSAMPNSEFFIREAAYLGPVASRALKKVDTIGLKGAARARNLESYVEGALIGLYMAGAMTIERYNNIAFLTAAGRLEELMKDWIDKEPKSVEAEQQESPR